jgi:hypothetical protein
VSRSPFSVLLLALLLALGAAPATAAPAQPRGDATTARAASHPDHHQRHHRKHHHGKHHRTHHRHRADRKLHAATVHRRTPVVAPVAAVPLQVGSFNVLGSSHTDGTHPERTGWRGSRPRIRDAGALFVARGLDVVGVQEFQPKQQAAFRETYGSSYDFVVGAGAGRPNGVIWRRSRFALVATDMVSVPYFWGKPTPMPLITLQDRRTGRDLMVLSVHNPADSHGNAQRWRNAATARELTTLSALRAAHPGTPVLWLGDMNDRTTFFCAATAGGVFHAAAGGSNDALGCAMPPYAGIDWVLGSANLAFTGWTVDLSTKERGISDHPMVFATAVLGSQPTVAPVAVPPRVPTVPGPPPDGPPPWAGPEDD